MIANALSDRQQVMLDFIAEYMAEFHRPPTVREIGQACRISSTSVVHYNLDVLERRGRLFRQRDITRSISLPGVACEHCGGTGRLEESA